MPVVETRETYAQVMEWHHCPACGGREWVHIVGQGFWCHDCNTHAVTREPRCDSGVIIEFDTAHAWSEADNCPPADVAMVKYLSTAATDWPEWWSYRGEYDDDTPEWSPTAPAEPPGPGAETTP